VTLGSDIVAGELLECPECGTELEVKSVAPVTLDEAPAAQEDWGE
jgi:alpha-aminoadipate carrier protein LysW